MGGLRLGRALWSHAHKAFLGFKNLLLTLCHVTVVHTYCLYIIMLSFWSDFLLMSLAGLPQSSPPKSVVMALTCIIKQQLTELELHWLAHLPRLCSSRGFSVCPCESERGSCPNRGSWVHSDNSNSVTCHLILKVAKERNERSTLSDALPFSREICAGIAGTIHTTNSVCLGTCVPPQDHKIRGRTYNAAVWCAEENAVRRMDGAAAPDFRFNQVHEFWANIWNLIIYCVSGYKWRLWSRLVWVILSNNSHRSTLISLVKNLNTA